MANARDINCKHLRENNLIAIVFNISTRPLITRIVVKLFVIKYTFVDVLTG